MPAIDNVEIINHPVTIVRQQLRSRVCLRVDSLSATAVARKRVTKGRDERDYHSCYYCAFRAQAVMMPLLPEGSSTSRCQCSSIHCLRCKLLIVQFRYLPSGVSDTGYGDQGLQRSTIKPHLSANSCKASSSEFTAAAREGKDQRCATATNSVLLSECSSHKVPHPVASWRRGGAIAIIARSICRRRIRKLDSR